MISQSQLSPKQDRSRKTRENLLDTLERLLITRQINDLSVADIAVEAGVTTGAIYSRFEGKQDLVRACAERFFYKGEFGVMEILDTIEKSAKGERDVVRIAVEHLVVSTLEFMPIMRAATTFNDPQSFEYMQKARGLVVEVLVSRLKSSPLPARELEARVKFILRTTTAVIRDTYMAGPSAVVLNVPAREFLKANRKLINKLVNRLADMALSYLEVADK